MTPQTPGKLPSHGKQKAEDERRLLVEAELEQMELDPEWGEPNFQLHHDAMKVWKECGEPRQPVSGPGAAEK